MQFKFKKSVVLFLVVLFVFEQSGFAQIGGQVLPAYFNPSSVLLTDKFRPVHLRYLSFSREEDSFQLLLDKGDSGDLAAEAVESSARQLMDYFRVGLALPNESFWVNLRPDEPRNIIDPDLAKTDIGRIFLESDVYLKKDLALLTSPDTPEGKQYWDALYAKAEELFGPVEMTLPVFTRPWIVPGEIIIRQNAQGVYIYKATLRVLLEQDYLKNGGVVFQDERIKKLNAYSSALIRKLFIPRLSRDVNCSRRYAPLRQVYYSLILSQWFKEVYAKDRTGAPVSYISKIDTKDLSGLMSKKSWSKMDYFDQYKRSFEKGEYNKTQTFNTMYGQTIRQYVSGGVNLARPVITTQPAAMPEAISRLPGMAGFPWAVSITMVPGSDGTMQRKPVAGTGIAGADGGAAGSSESDEEKFLYKALAEETTNYKLAEISSRLGLDTRPLRQGLLHPLYIAYAMAARKVVNPGHDPKRVWYKGAGVGISDFLLSTDAAEADFEAYYNGGISVDILRALSDLDIIGDMNNRRAVAEYRRTKFESGYGGAFDVENSRDVAMYLKAELKAMEIDIKKVNVDVDKRTAGSDTVEYPRITFEWAYPGQKPKTRSITFLDIGYPFQKIIYRDSYDIYYQRAAMELPFAYKPSDGSRSYILDVYDRLSPGGYFLTDDNAFDRAFRKYSYQGMNFPLDLPVISIPLNPAVIEGIKKVRNYPEDAGVLYGCEMTVRQAPLDKSASGATLDGGRIQESKGTEKTSVRDQIIKTIEAKGRITFAEFMERALYQSPDAGNEGGFYAEKLEIGQHFSTHPVAFSPRYGRQVAEKIFEMWKGDGAPERFDLVNMGEGNGVFLRDMLDTLKNEHPEMYKVVKAYVVEISSHLIETQKKNLQGHTVEWVGNSALHMPFSDGSIRGCIVSNELVDSFPVHRLKVVNGTLKEKYVGYQNGDFVEVLDDPSTPELREYLDSLDKFPQSDGDITVNLNAVQWLRELARVLGKGHIITIDYDYTPAAVYKTLKNPLDVRVAGKYRNSPFADIGGVDITTDVDFVALSGLARQAGLQVKELLSEEDYFSAEPAGKEMMLGFPYKVLVVGADGSGLKGIGRAQNGNAADTGQEIESTDGGSAGLRYIENGMGPSDGGGSREAGETEDAGTRRLTEALETAGSLLPAGRFALIGALATEKNEKNRMGIAEKLGIDMRPVRSGLLGIAHVGYDMALKEIVNSGNKDTIVVSGGAGSNWADVILSSNASEAYFIDQQAFKKEALEEALSGWDALGKSEEDVLFLEQRREKGYTLSRPRGAQAIKGVERKFLLELKCMGVQHSRADGSPNIIVRDEADGTLVVRFEWQYKGAKNPKEYSVVFLTADITDPVSYPESLKRMLARGFDYYYQRAGYLIAGRYPEFIGAITAGLKDNGYIVSDDRFIVTERFQQETWLADFDAVLSGIKASAFSKKGEIISADMACYEKAIELERAQQLAEENREKGLSVTTVEGVLSSKEYYDFAHYGWHMYIRQKSGYRKSGDPAALSGTDFPEYSSREYAFSSRLVQWLDARNILPFDRTQGVYIFRPRSLEYLNILEIFIRELHSLPLNNEVGKSLLKDGNSADSIHALVSYLEKKAGEYANNFAWDSRDFNEISRVFNERGFERRIFINVISPQSGQDGISYLLKVMGKPEVYGYNPPSVSLFRYHVKSDGTVLLNAFFSVRADTGMINLSLNEGVSDTRDRLLAYRQIIGSADGGAGVDVPDLQSVKGLNTLVQNGSKYEPFFRDRLAERVAEMFNTDKNNVVIESLFQKGEGSVTIKVKDNRVTHFRYEVVYPYKESEPYISTNRFSDARIGDIPGSQALVISYLAFVHGAQGLWVSGSDYADFQKIEEEAVEELKERKGSRSLDWYNNIEVRLDLAALRILLVPEFRLTAQDPFPKEFDLPVAGENGSVRLVRREEGSFAWPNFAFDVYWQGRKVNPLAQEGWKSETMPLLPNVTGEVGDRELSIDVVDLGEETGQGILSPIFQYMAGVAYKRGIKLRGKTTINPGVMRAFEKVTTDFKYDDAYVKEVLKTVAGAELRNSTSRHDYELYGGGSFYFTPNSQGQARSAFSRESGTYIFDPTIQIIDSLYRIRIAYDDFKPLSLRVFDLGYFDKKSGTWLSLFDHPPAGLESERDIAALISRSTALENFNFNPDGTFDIDGKHMGRLLAFSDQVDLIGTPKPPGNITEAGDRDGGAAETVAEGDSKGPLSDRQIHEKVKAEMASLGTDELVDVLADSVLDGEDPGFLQQKWDILFGLLKNSDLEVMAWHNAPTEKLDSIQKGGLRANFTDFLGRENTLFFHVLNFSDNEWESQNSVVLSNLAQELTGFGWGAYGHVVLGDHGVVLFPVSMLESYKSGFLDDAPMNHGSESLVDYPGHMLPPGKFRILDMTIHSGDLRDIVAAYEERGGRTTMRQFIQILYMKSVWLERLIRFFGDGKNAGLGFRTGEAAEEDARDGGENRKAVELDLRRLKLPYNDESRDIDDAIVDRYRGAETVKLERYLEERNFYSAEAAFILGRVGSLRIFEKFLDTFTKKDDGWRDFYARILGAFGVRRALEPLIAALQDPDVRVRLGAIKGLAYLGAPEGVEPLLSLLRKVFDVSPGDENKGWSIRNEVVEALGWIADPKSASLLMDLLKAQQEKDDSVTATTAVALGRLLDNPDLPEGMRKEIVMSLEELSGGHKKIAVRSAADWALKNSRPDTDIEKLILQIEEEKESVGEQLIRAGEPAVDALKRTVKNYAGSSDKGGEYTRRKAVSILGRIGGPRAAQALIDLLFHDSSRFAIYVDAGVFYTAIRGLGIEAVESLIQALGRQEEKNLTYIIDLLGDIGDDRAVEPLIKTLQHKDISVRAAVIRALKSIGGPIVVSPLLEVVRSDSSREIRREAAKALGSSGDPAVVPLTEMIEGRNSPDTAARVFAAEALGILGDVRAIAPLAVAAREADPAGPAASQALIRIGRSLGKEAFQRHLSENGIQVPGNILKDLGVDNEREMNNIFPVRVTLKTQTGMPVYLVMNPGRSVIGDVDDSQIAYDLYVGEHHTRVFPLANNFDSEIATNVVIRVGYPDRSSPYSLYIFAMDLGDQKSSGIGEAVFAFLAQLSREKKCRYLGAWDTMNPVILHLLEKTTDFQVGKWLAEKNSKLNFGFFYSSDPHAQISDIWYGATEWDPDVNDYKLRNLDTISKLMYDKENFTLSVFERQHGGWRAVREVSFDLKNLTINPDLTFVADAQDGNQKITGRIVWSYWPWIRPGGAPKSFENSYSSVPWGKSAQSAADSEENTDAGAGVDNAVRAAVDGGRKSRKAITAKMSDPVFDEDRRIAAEIIEQEPELSAAVRDLITKSYLELDYNHPIMALNDDEKDILRELFRKEYYYELNDRFDIASLLGGGRPAALATLYGGAIYLRMPKVQAVLSRLGIRFVTAPARKFGAYNCIIYNGRLVREILEEYLDFIVEKFPQYSYLKDRELNDKWIDVFMKDVVLRNTGVTGFLCGYPFAAVRDFLGDVEGNFGLNFFTEKVMGTGKQFLSVFDGFVVNKNNLFESVQAAVKAKQGLNTAVYALYDLHPNSYDGGTEASWEELFSNDGENRSEAQSARSALSMPGKDTKAGIDFRNLPVAAQPLPALQPGARVSVQPAIPLPELDTAWKQIRDMVDKGVIPSGKNIQEYVMSCCQKGDVSGDVEKVLACISEILRIEEDYGVAAEPGFIQLLCALDSNNNGPELQAALSAIVFP